MLKTVATTTKSSPYGNNKLHVAITSKVAMAKGIYILSLCFAWYWIRFEVYQTLLTGK